MQTTMTRGKQLPTGTTAVIVLVLLSLLLLLLYIYATTTSVSDLFFLPPRRPRQSQLTVARCSFRMSACTRASHTRSHFADPTAVQDSRIHWLRGKGTSRRKKKKETNARQNNVNNNNNNSNMTTAVLRQYGKHVRSPSARSCISFNSVVFENQTTLRFDFWKSFLFYFIVIIVVVMVVVVRRMCV